MLEHRAACCIGIAWVTLCFELSLIDYIVDLIDYGSLIEEETVGSVLLCLLYRAFTYVQSQKNQYVLWYRT